MMDYKEMAAIVKERGDAIIAEKARRATLIKRISFSASSVAAVAIAALCVWHNKDLMKYPDPNKNNYEICTDSTTLVSSSVAITTSSEANVDIKTTIIADSTVKTDTVISATSETSTLYLNSDKKSSTKTNSVTTADKVENRLSPVATMTNTSVNVSKSTALTSTTTSTVTTSLSEGEIRMNVEIIKRYLAAISMLAMSSNSTNNDTSVPNMNVPYVPRKDSEETAILNYIHENNLNMDFDGNGTLNTYDSYALYTYIHEIESLPDGYSERCEANGDINKDGAINDDDFLFIFDYCMNFRLNDALVTYREGTRNGKIEGPKEGTIEVFNAKISPSCTEEEREKYLCEYLYESYTYGSKENISDFYYYIKDATHNFYSFKARIDDFHYNLFVSEAIQFGIDFDINDDGIIDVNDAFDLYIYNMCQPYDDSYRQYCMLDSNYGNLDQLISLDKDELEKIRRKCDPILDLAKGYALCFADYDDVIDLIYRYIITSDEFTYEKQYPLYYKEYRGGVMVHNEPLNLYFLYDIQRVLDNYFDSIYKMEGVKDYESEKLKQSEIVDEKYMHDNDAYLELLQIANDDFNSGKTKDMYDLNKDGKFDYYDRCLCEIYRDELYGAVTAEYSILPEDVRHYLDTEFDVDNDGLAGDIIDLMAFDDVAGRNHVSANDRYESERIYLELYEQKLNKLQ